MTVNPARKCMRKGKSQIRLFRRLTKNARNHNVSQTPGLCIGGLKSPKTKKNRHFSSTHERIRAQTVVSLTGKKGGKGKEVGFPPGDHSFEGGKGRRGKRGRGKKRNGRIH